MSALLWLPGEDPKGDLQARLESLVWQLRAIDDVLNKHGCERSSRDLPREIDWILGTSRRRNADLAAENASLRSELEAGRASRGPR